jgi:hypothetical protein
VTRCLGFVHPCPNHYIAHRLLYLHLNPGADTASLAQEQGSAAIRTGPHLDLQHECSELRDEAQHTFALHWKADIWLSVVFHDKVMGLLLAPLAKMWWSQHGCDTRFWGDLHTMLNTACSSAVSCTIYCGTTETSPMQRPSSRVPHTVTFPTPTV